MSATYTPVELGQDCDVTLIPSGQKMTLRAGEQVMVTQALGGTVTVQTASGQLARISPETPTHSGSPSNRAARNYRHRAPSILEQVIEQLRTVFDPEIPVNMVDLGLIYACDAQCKPTAATG